MPNEIPEIPLSAEQYIILREWNRLGSVRQVQKSTGHSFAMIRKTLLTAGVVPTEQCRQVRKLLDSGKTVEEIASILGTTPHNIQNYLPYLRGSYTLPQTENRKRNGGNRMPNIEVNDQIIKKIDQIIRYNEICPYFSKRRESASGVIEYALNRLIEAMADDQKKKGFGGVPTEADYEKYIERFGERFDPPLDEKTIKEYVL